MKTRIGFGWRLAGALLLLAAAAHTRADQLIMKGTGQIIEAKSIRYKASTMEYIVLTMDNTTVPVPAKNVDRAVVPKPAAYDAAVASVLGGKFDAAIAPLEAIISEYQGLEWDNSARDALGQAYMGKKDYKKAVFLYKGIQESMPAERIGLGIRRRYWEALKGAEQYALLKKELEELIATGPRNSAAMAQLLRGDMYLAQGQKNEALLDYLRTVVLYEQVKEMQPEALFKAARLLEELRDPRAAELKKKLLGDYPNSREAKMAAGG